MSMFIHYLFSNRLNYCLFPYPPPRNSMLLCVPLLLLAYPCCYWRTLVAINVPLLLLAYPCCYWRTLVAIGVPLLLLAYPCCYCRTIVVIGVSSFAAIPCCRCCIFLLDKSLAPAPWWNGMPNAQGILWLCLMHLLLEEAAALVGMVLLDTSS